MTQEPGQELERFRQYLHLLARLQIGRQLQGKIDPSGIVQVTLLEAYRDWDQLLGQNEGQRAAWLRRVLANNLADELRRWEAAKRDAGRERSLEADLDASSCRLGALLADRGASPSTAAVRQEDAVRLAEALAQLPESQRRAVELHHLHGLALLEVARELNCSKPAVAGLLHRGLKALRRRLTENESDEDE
jgi:RNA polymerase sigma-70 factor (ECF subfamily)